MPESIRIYTTSPPGNDLPGTDCLSGDVGTHGTHGDRIRLVAIQSRKIVRQIQNYRPWWCWSEEDFSDACDTGAVSRKSWFDNWPHHCKTCSGSGSIPNYCPADWTARYRVCPYCREQNVCPRCGEVEAFGETNHPADGVCRTCGWYEVDEPAKATVSEGGAR